MPRKEKIDKQELSNRFTAKILEEIGLEIGPYGSVVDQDTGLSLQFNGKNLKTGSGDSPARIHLSDILFNPIGDLKQMRNLFSYYIKKEEAENPNRVSGMFFQLPRNDGETSGAMVLQYTDKDEGLLKEIQSKKYCNESLCYADLMMQYNGEENVDLSEYDFPIETVSKKRKRK